MAISLDPSWIYRRVNGWITVDMVNIDTIEVFHGGLGLSDAEIHVSHYVNKSEKVTPSFSRAVTAESTLMAPVGLGTSASGRVVG